MRRTRPVTAVSPDSVERVSRRTGTRDKEERAGQLCSGRDVAREGYEAVMKGHSVVVNGGIYRFLVWLNGAMPRSLSRWVSARAGRQYRKT